VALLDFIKKLYFAYKKKYPATVTTDKINRVKKHKGGQVYQNPVIIKMLL
jgi:hypothetical protein